MGTSPQQKGSVSSETRNASHRASPILFAAISFSARAVRLAHGKASAIVLTYDDALRRSSTSPFPSSSREAQGHVFPRGDITPADMLRWRGGTRGPRARQPFPVSSLPARVAPEPQNYTENYDVARMLGEIAAMNNVLFGIDGRDPTYWCPAARCSSAASTTRTRCALRPRNRAHGRRPVQVGGHRSRRLDPFRVPSWGPVDTRTARNSSPTRPAFVRRTASAYCSSTASAATTSKFPRGRTRSSWIAARNIPRSG